jgi:hypothetical protein
MKRTARNQKREQDQKIKRILLSVGGLLLLAFAAFFFFQNVDLSGGTPKLAVDQKSIDFGTVKNFTEKTFTITITNTGDGVLRFKEKPYVEVVDGCCPPQLTIGSMVLKPGETTTVTSNPFSMHPGMDGKHDYAVHLKTNDATQPDFVVNVLSNWVQ